MSEIYFSTDIETFGPIPAIYSMLSFGSAAFFNGKLVDTYYANLETLPNTTAHPETEKWWSTQPEALAACRKDPQKPEIVMPDYVRWVTNLSQSLKGSPVFVAYPAGFDFTFMYWYLIRFAGTSPFSFSALDIKSYAAGMLNKDYRQCTKRNLPKNWFGKTKHNHNALSDAIEQGELFCNILNHQNFKKEVCRGS